MDFLDKILNTGSGLFTAYTANQTANDQADATKAAAQANAKVAAQNSATTKLMIIGGGVLAVVVVLVLVFRRK